MTWLPAGYYFCVDNPADLVRTNNAVQVLGRVGMLFYGAVHVLVAWLALQIVLGDGAQSDSKGALAEIASTTIGPILLWTVAIGLFLFALWQYAEAASGFRYIAEKRKRVGKRVGAAARATTATLIGVGAIKIVTGKGGTNTTGEQQELTARVLALPYGQWLVGAVAIGILVTAAVIFHKGVKRSFTRDLDMSELPDGTQRWVKRVGRVGWIGKGVAYGVISVLVGAAAVTADPEESGGMDKALHTVADQPYGAALLILIALGLAAFGVYCFAAAKAHRA